MIVTTVEEVVVLVMVESGRVMVVTMTEVIMDGSGRTISFAITTMGKIPTRGNSCSIGSG